MHTFRIYSSRCIKYSLHIDVRKQRFWKHIYYNYYIMQSAYNCTIVSFTENSHNAAVLVIGEYSLYVCTNLYIYNKDIF